jgi:two-component system, NtrC family, sensor kinase
MRSGEIAGGKAASARRRKAVVPKRRKAASRRRSSPAAGEEADVALLTRERDEALEQQRATFAVLRAISTTPTDTASILGAIAESVARLLDVTDAEIIMRVEGDLVKSVMKYGPSRNWPAGTTRALSRDWVTGRAVIDRTPIHVADLWSAEREFPQGAALARQYGHRTTLAVPLLRDGSAIGAILIRRMEVKPFTDKQIELVSSFASQAVIAVENARLFNETQEALAHQTATSDVLQVIGSSMANAQPVFERILDITRSLVGSEELGILLAPGDGLLHMAAHRGTRAEAFKNVFPTPIEQTAANVVMVEQRQRYFADALNDPDAPPGLARAAGVMGNYSSVMTPMIWEGRSIGVIAVAREPNAVFSEKELGLLRTFADQAVIAIENARLFEEVQARTRDLSESLQQQTATSDVLKVISRSAFDLQSVFDTLAASATELCEADTGIIFLRDGDVFRARATAGARPEYLEFLKAHPRHLHDKSMVPRVARVGAVVQIPDVQLDRDFQFPGVNEARGQPARSVLGVPLLRNGTVEGVFVVSHHDVKPFTQRQIELVEAFSDQAVIAIENVRLFDEVQARTRELSRSLEDLRAAQDRLIQTEKLASLGQLTAGIAHEIKNPLNFVNNFSALSAELTDELKNVLIKEELSSEGREEVDELTRLLKDNLDKVIQHGKRADSIVKNMLLHSREGPGERRSADINALVGESLNLAYHGARAEKAGFNIKLTHDFDPNAGALDLYPQEMTRALLNLISNGFYAAAKRKVEAGDATFEPVLSAATRSLGKSIEIRIRDNGIGIPPAVREKMFNPFFTTKPTGEGTGLGLSMTHDIIVKQHGGRIDVETKLGEFTEFIITLPRDNRTAAGGELE